MPFRRLSWTWPLLFVVLAVFQGVGATIALGDDTSAMGTTDEAEAYLNKVEQKIMAVWKRPPKTDGLKVTLRYNLARNGFVSAVRIERVPATRTLTTQLFKRFDVRVPSRGHRNHSRLANCEWFSILVCQLRKHPL